MYWLIELLSWFGSLNAYDKSTESVTVVGAGFSYKCMATKIGEGGFGSVYYAELRGEMDMQVSGEFLTELKVLTRVHHLNLVRLIGFCTETCLFLVYEEPLPWSARLQIALDSARGLEYIHEHTVPVYIHRDIKSVADFGLTKLTEVGCSSLPTRLVCTFGYMPPDPSLNQKKGLKKIGDEYPLICDHSRISKKNLISQKIFKSSILQLTLITWEKALMKKLTQTFHCFITFYHSSCAFQDRKTKWTIGGGYESGSLYYLDHNLIAAAHHSMNSPYLWHCRLGHPSIKTNRFHVASIRTCSICSIVT
ncbi:hypothetical protein AMTRI_Chr10g228820 [Amborella trichopoda]